MSPATCDAPPHPLTPSRLLSLPSGTATFDFGQFVPLQASAAEADAASGAGDKQAAGNPKRRGKLNRGGSVPSHISSGTTVNAVLSPGQMTRAARVGGRAGLSQSLGRGDVRAIASMSLADQARQAAAAKANLEAGGSGGAGAGDAKTGDGDAGDDSVQRASPVSPTATGEAARFTRFSLGGAGSRSRVASGDDFEEEFGRYVTRRWWRCC